MSVVSLLNVTSLSLYQVPHPRLASIAFSVLIYGFAHYAQRAPLVDLTGFALPPSAFQES